MKNRLGFSWIPVFIFILNVGFNAGCTKSASHYKSAAEKGSL